jgi:ParB-like chromosome segregation protein Spo0J
MSWVADKIEHWPLARLLPYARNARTHSDDQVAQIAASIVEFGFTNPCLVGADGVLVAGHGRLLAARKLGLDTVPVVVLDHLTPIQRRALVIADNRIAENSGWDDAMRPGPDRFRSGRARRAAGGRGNRPGRRGR